MIKLRNGILIPKLGLGTFLMNNEDETESAILNALKIGYRHIDTAQMYGNEGVIGSALQKSGLKRSEYYLTTKLHNHHSKAVTKSKILQSLKDLKTDYLDLLLIHWPNHDDNINLQTWQVFEELYEEGLVKAIGVSNFTRYQLLKLIEKAKIVPHVNQVEHHPNLPQYPLKQFMKEYGIQMIGYGPLMRGQVFGDSLRKIFEPIASKHQASIAQIVIAWGLAKEVIMIPKSVNEERLLENFNSQNIKLDLEDIAIIDSINAGRRYYADPANNAYGLFIK